MPTCCSTSDIVVEDNKWYLTPKERFFNRMRVHLDTGMSKPAAFAAALEEKKLEEEARDMEFEVQKQQAEVCVVEVLADN